MQQHSTQPIPALFCWSGGKDSAYALHQVLKQGIYEVKYLLSTFNGVYKRLSMHGVQEALIEQQAATLDLPLLKVFVYENNNAEYEQQMETTLRKAKQEGIGKVIFGDIFLEDLRRYREEKMAQVNMNCVFPLWQTNTAQMVQSFIAEGFKSITCCVNASVLDARFCGRIINNSFVSELPAEVDPCGENGEFHSFCYDGPLFVQPIAFTKGETIFRTIQTDSNQPNLPNGFWYTELLPLQP